MTDAATVFTPVKQFLALVLDGEPPTLTALYRALDELEATYRGAPNVDPDDIDVSEPDRDQFAPCRGLAPRFPQLGFYNASDPHKPLEGATLVGDALDDLVDIVLDLQSSIWLFDNGYVNDALWHFRLLYESHWGEHLQGLRRHLHELIFVQHLE